ncbi:MAG TPA: pyridoxamine 5'-phosphate oxidase [Hyphomicrobiales bacterium]|nr:pyridoxamine 5'-phosphate oxidase [Hyphomicrobiales bacterium]
MNLEQLRREYLQGGLRHKDLPASPHVLFERWLEQAIAAALPDPTAMVVATVNADGQPSQRIVLLKHQDEEGFVFYTNYDSRKGNELRDNDRISLLFPWHSLERQVKVSGRALKVSQEESSHYFASRPRDSQLAAWASHQSSEIRSRDYLIQQLELMRERFGTEDVPLPDYWGGFRVVPHAIEFWQGGAHRLHDRFVYRLEADADWSIHRLSP